RRAEERRARITEVRTDRVGPIERLHRPLVAARGGGRRNGERGGNEDREQSGGENGELAVLSTAADMSAEIGHEPTVDPGPNALLTTDQRFANDAWRPSLEPRTSLWAPRRR